jgi:DNA modification methylase
MNTFYTGDAIKILEILPSESVHCCVTSPPYYGLRDYGVEGQFGLEKNPEEYVNKLVDVFKEVRRVLRNDGTVWLNIGDSYNGCGNNKPHTGSYGVRGHANEQDKFFTRGLVENIKTKDLIGIPWMIAFALRNDGWYLRSDIIWHKSNPMPESVKDRPTKSHEYIFLLSKNAKYYYDFEAIKEPSIYQPGDREDIKKGGFNSKYHDNDSARKGDESFRSIREMKNKRSVWKVPIKPFKGAHFAVFPPDLIKPCILAGCPIGGQVLDPFGGSGTVAMVASELGRDSVYIDLNPDYTQMAKAR